MKYLKVLIIILILVLIGIGSYYVYLVISPPKLSNNLKQEDFEKTTPFVFEPKTGADLKYKDYTSSDLSMTDGPIVINGNFQAIDSIQKEINGISYTHVLGILSSDNSFSRVWLTNEEYKRISEYFSENIISMRDPVVITLSQGGLSLEKVLP